MAPTHSQKGLKIGRPTVLTPKKQAEFIAAVREGNYISTACALIGVDRSFMAAWRMRAKEGIEPFATFITQVYKARALAERDSLEKIKLAGRDGTWQAEAWFLERAHPKKWGKIDRLALESAVKDHDEGTLDLSELTEEELAILEKVVARRREQTAGIIDVKAQSFVPLPSQVNVSTSVADADNKTNGEDKND